MYLWRKKKNNCRIISGNCQVVMNTLRKYQSNDSIAVDIFKKEYVIDNMQNTENLFKKQYTEIIHFFESKNGQKYNCHLKDTKMVDPILLK